MALTFHVEDQMHQRRRTFADDKDNTFLNLCRHLAKRGTLVLDIIDPYTDTMLNYIQLDRIIIELQTALDGNLSQSERALVIEVQVAAQEAREVSGFLFIQGD
jgi:hypothetical protein